MKFRYRIVAIDVDLEGNMFFEPVGYSERYGNVYIDNITELKYPYADDDIEMTIAKACDLCFTKEPIIGKGSPIERYLNIKGVERAMRDKKVIIFFWNDEDGYIIKPTKKVPKKGYEHMKDKEFRLGIQPAKGEIANAIRQSIEISTI